MTTLNDLEKIATHYKLNLKTTILEEIGVCGLGITPSKTYYIDLHNPHKNLLIQVSSKVSLSDVVSKAFVCLEEVYGKIPCLK